MLLFVLVDAVFAFPMENAFPFYVMAVTTGLIQKVLQLPTWVASKKISHFLITLSFLEISCYGFLFILSYQVEGVFHKNQENYGKLEFACKFFPSHWQTCLEKANFELDTSDLIQAEGTARSILLRHSLHFPAMSILGYSLQNQGRNEEACTMIQQYDQLFQNQSSYHSELINNCSHL
jgi:hypothetical protein